MTENTVLIKGRFLNKHDTEENWNKATNFAPLLGETIVYDPDDKHHYPRYKTGIWDGKSEKTADMLIMNLPFANQPDTISNEDLLELLDMGVSRAIPTYTTFKLHLVNYDTELLMVAPIRYAAGLTTWGDLVAAYPEYFVTTSTEWDKATGKPFVKFAEPFNGQDYVMKKITPVNPDDPVSGPCTTIDLVVLDKLRATYVCLGTADCPMCKNYKTEV